MRQYLLSYSSLFTGFTEPKHKRIVLVLRRSQSKRHWTRTTRVIWVLGLESPTVFLFAPLWSEEKSLTEGLMRPAWVVSLGAGYEGVFLLTPSVMDSLWMNLAWKFSPWIRTPSSTACARGNIYTFILQQMKWFCRKEEWLLSRITIPPTLQILAANVYFKISLDS